MSKRKSVPKGKRLRILLFSVAVTSLTVLFLWQLRSVLKLIEPSEKIIFEEKNDFAVVNYSLLTPETVYLTAEEEQFVLSENSSETYFLSSFGQDMLERGVYGDEGRKVERADITAGQDGFVFVYSFSFPRAVWQELGASEKMMEAYPAEGVNEILFYPSAYYWQDSVMYLCNTQTDFCWKLTLYGTDRNESEQETLDYFVSLAEKERDGATLYVCTEDCGYIYPEYEAASYRSFTLSSPFETEDGISASEARLFALKVFSYSDTVSDWSFGDERMIFTNDVGTLRIEQDGRFFYSAPGSSTEASSYLEAYEIAIKMMKRAFTLVGSSLLEIRPTEIGIKSGNYYFDFAYFYKGIQVSGTERIRITVRNNEVRGFAGTLYRFTVANASETSVFTVGQMQQLFESLYPEGKAELVWTEWESRWYPALQGTEGMVLPFEVQEEPIPEESAPEESAQEESAPEDAVPEESVSEAKS